MAHFFVSYNKADRRWAEWIAWQLEEAGYTTVIQVWDFLPGTNFVSAMQQAATTADSTIAVLSPDYLNDSARFSQAEWMTAFAKDPTGRDAALIPVRVRPCEPQGMLSIISYIDLVDLKLPAAKEKLLAGVHATVSAGRAKPVTEPAFPGGHEGSPPRPPPERSILKKPEFPGPKTIWDPLLELVDTRLGPRGRLLVSLVALAFVVVPSIVPVARQVGEMIERWKPTPAPLPTPGLVRADPTRFAIAVAQLANDEVGYRNTILQELGTHAWLEVLPVDRRIETSGQVQGDAIKAGHVQARAFLEESGAQVLIWGTVLGKGMNLAQLYWTPREDLQANAANRYPLANEDLSLPKLFWEDLRKIVGLLVLTQAAAISERQERPDPAQLRTFVNWVRDLPEREELAWTADERGQVRFIIGNGLTRLGEQAHSKADVDNAVGTYRRALQDFAPGSNALARTQNNLCVALRTLGELGGGTAALQQAVEACQAALEIYTKAETPLDWARTQNNLGNVLLRLGESEGGTEKLRAAEARYRAALEVYTRHATPVDWAMAQNNLGLALERQGERAGGTATLQAAVAAYHEALTVRQHADDAQAMTNTNLCSALTALGAQSIGTQELADAVIACDAALAIYVQLGQVMKAATTRNNLGNVLTALGEREVGTTALQRAVDTYRDALRDRTRDKWPREWALTKSNLCFTLAALGEQDSGSPHLQAAVQECDDALTERQRDRLPTRWAATQTNRCRALQALGEREQAIPRLQEALAACTGALTVRTRAEMPLQWAETKFHLGNVLVSLGKRESGTQSLQQAVEMYRDALEVRTQAVAPVDSARTQHGLGNAQRLLSERTHDATLACAALASHAGAWSVLREVPAFAPAVAAAATADIQLIDTAFGPTARQDCAQRHPDIFAVFPGAASDRSAGQLPNPEA